MSRICEAGIKRTFKRKKAECVWPNYREWKDDIERCGGDVTFSVSVEGGGPCPCGDYCYCAGPTLEVEAKCTRCQDPYVEGITREVASSYDACSVLERFLNG